MGGNGSYSHFISGTLGTFETDRYRQIDSIGLNKVIVVTTQSNDKRPVNSFTSDMYYVTAPEHPERITCITFYNKKTHGIKKSIDIKYDKDGNMIPYSVVYRKGKVRIEGTHVHKWFSQENGSFGRKSHDGGNCFDLTKTDFMYLSRALRYNAKKQKNI